MQATLFQTSAAQLSFSCVVLLSLSSMACVEEDPSEIGDEAGTRESDADSTDDVGTTTDGDTTTDGESTTTDGESTTTTDEESTTADEESTTADEESTTADSDGGCSISDDCPSDEICVDEVCEDANLYNYEVRVMAYTPPDCEDGFGGAEIVYYAYADAELLHESSESSCPAAWVRESFVYNPPAVFQIDFWEIDTLGDDLLIALCWQDEFNDCLPVPKAVLHDGELIIDSQDTEIEMRFDPILP